MSEQEQQREAERYQEWCAERDAHEEQQYHIYLEERIQQLEATIEAVRGLPDKWYDRFEDDILFTPDECADELEASLK